MKHSGLSLRLVCVMVTLIVFNRATDSVIEMTCLPSIYLEDDKMPLLNTVSVENERVTLQFQKNCPTGKDKMIENINEVLETDVGVSNEDCKCVNVKPGLQVKKYRKWYIFQPTFDLPTFIVELQGPKSKMVQANIEENQMILKKKKYFVVKSACDICLRGNEEIQLILLHCNELHMYCAQCIPKFPQSRCPLCKEPITQEVRLLDKIIPIVDETILLPAALFDQYVFSWIQPLLIAVHFARFEDAYWKFIFISYMRFFTANSVAIVAEILTENCAFNITCLSTTVREILKSYLQISKDGIFNIVDNSLQPFLYFFTLLCTTNLLVDFRWMVYGMVVHNTNRFVKHITNNKIGINISLFAPTIFAMWTPLIGMVSQEVILNSMHTILLLSLLQSAKKYNFKLFVISYLLVILIVINVIFVLHTYKNHQFMTELFVLIKFPYRYLFIPILNGLICSIFLILTAIPNIL